jgi:hypothetical protein
MKLYTYYRSQASFRVRIASRSQRLCHPGWKVRTRLAAGGKWIRTLGPALEKSASVAEK